MPHAISRRHFLKLSAAAALSLAFRRRPRQADAQPPLASQPRELGRVTRALKYYDRPSFSAKELGAYRVDTVLNVLQRAAGDAQTSHNAVWLRVDDGWVYSSFVQPVRDEINAPSLDVPEGGFLAEVTVPFTEALRAANGFARAYRFYYSSTHWVHRAVADETGRIWYRVLDDRYRVHYFVLAEHLRRVTDEELTPLSPGVLDKRLEVDLRQQKLIAYENGRPVFTAALSSGHKGWDTPTGRFRVERKRPSRHMAAGDAAAVGFDLPGIPWVAYIHWSGVAFHGTYWHNDFGRPRSAGCINLTPADAKWIYRWTLPVVPSGVDLVRDKSGTEVIVF